MNKQYEDDDNFGNSKRCDDFISGCSGEVFEIIGYEPNGDPKLKKATKTEAIYFHDLWLTELESRIKAIEDRLDRKEAGEILALFNKDEQGGGYNE